MSTTCAHTHMLLRVHMCALLRAATSLKTGTAQSMMWYILGVNMVGAGRAQLCFCAVCSIKGHHAALKGTMQH